VKQAEVEIGGVYWCKVSGRVVPVRIDCNCTGSDWNIGWAATNLKTGRQVHIKLAHRLRGRLGPQTEILALQRSKDRR